jgi:phosphoribosylformimino-5-aminoimidazole carboxamide ribotide isomerase
VSGPTLFAAVDILDSKAVRLTRGAFEESKVYDQDPLVAARRWLEEGAEALHVVDLDGARAGRPISLDHLRKIAELPLRVQYGGGLRSLESVSRVLDCGAERAVIGTAAFSDADLLQGALDRFGDRVAVAVDVRGGRVATAGWTATTGIEALAAVAMLRRRGVGRIVYTNVDQDGTLSGPDLEEVGKVSEAIGDDRFLYSGGIGSLDDLRALVSLGLSNLEGVIVGKALYERRFTVAEAVKALAPGVPEESAP